MDPIQKMEILENYPYILPIHPCQQQLSNEIQNIENSAPDAAVVASAVMPETIKIEPLDVSDVAANGDANDRDGDSGGSSEKPNDQNVENSQSDSVNAGNDTKFTVPESNGSTGTSDANGAKRRKCSAADTSASSTSEENGENGKAVNNDDYHFLMSMQPFMSELSLAQKLRLRMKIQKLVFDELYGCYNDMRT